MPGVSTKITCACGEVLTPRIRVRVVCGLGLTLASLAPTKAFSNVDLPTFGRPTKATKPQRNCSSGEDVGVCRVTNLLVLTVFVVTTASRPSRKQSRSYATSSGDSESH